MSVPNFKNKHNKDSLFSAKDFLSYLSSINKKQPYPTPDSAIFIYQAQLFDEICKSYPGKKFSYFAPEEYLITKNKKKILILSKFGIGAPAATTILEEIIACGVKKIISLGTAGSLQKDLAIGDILVCQKALRDEGVSHHYLKSSKFSYADKKLTDKLKQKLVDSKNHFKVGSSWTVDAIYRETVAEAKHYQKENISVVEMEAAALFAVAKYRKVSLTSIFTISDCLGDFCWRPHFKHDLTEKNLRLIFNISLKTLSD